MGGAVGGALTATFVVPTLTSPYSYPIKKVDPDYPRLAIDDFDSNFNTPSKCPIIGRQVLGSPLMDPDVDITSVPNKLVLRVKPKFRYREGSYQFVVGVLAKGGGKARTKPIQLDVVCAPTSTELTEPELTRN